METEVITLPAERPDTSPLALLARLIERGADADQLGKLTDLVERWRATEAQEKFANALAAFQSECPPVHKGRRADRYAFASYDDVMATAGPFLRKHGITVSFTIAQADDKMLNITCRIRVGSYFEDRCFPSPVAIGVKLTAPQEYGMTVKYLQRYALCAALNIVTTDIVDNDGAGLDPLLTPDQVGIINDLIGDCQKGGKLKDLKRFWAWLQVDGLHAVTQSLFNKTVAELNRLRKEAAK